MIPGQHPRSDLTRQNVEAADWLHPSACCSGTVLLRVRNQGRHVRLPVKRLFTARPTRQIPWSTAIEGTA